MDNYEILEKIKQSNVKRLKLITFRLVFGLIISIMAVVLTLIWYDWKLLLLFMLWIAGNNFTNKKTKGE